MGKCKKLNPIQAINDPQIEINEVRDIQGACGDAGTAANSLSKYIPQNWEYEFVSGRGSCHFCGKPPHAMTCSTGCSDGCCAIVGSKGGYKRVSYNADPLQCCLAQTATIGNFTCDPKYRNNTSEDCRQYLKKYCKEDNGGNYAIKYMSRIL